jgi:hypothetical protein
VISLIEGRHDEIELAIVLIDGESTHDESTCIVDLSSSDEGSRSVDDFGEFFSFCGFDRLLRKI